MMPAMHPAASAWLRRALEEFESAVARAEFVTWHANYDLRHELAEVGVPADEIEAAAAAIFEAA